LLGCCLFVCLLGSVGRWVECWEQGERGRELLLCHLLTNSTRLVCVAFGIDGAVVRVCVVVCCVLLCWLVYRCSITSYGI